MNRIAIVDILQGHLRRQSLLPLRIYSTFYSTFYVTLYVAFLLVGMAACSRPALPAWLGGEDADATPTPVAANTHLQLWAWPSTAAEDAHLQSLVTNFAAQHPTITVELTLPDHYTRRLRTALGTESAPDIFLLTLQQLPDLVAQGLVAPLPAQFAAADDMYPHLRRATQRNGIAYCVPQSFYTLALFYNRTLFDAAALPHPDERWDWAAMQAAAAALTTPAANIYGLVLPADVSRWATFLAQAGGAIVNDAGTAMAINNPAGAEALALYTGLVLEAVAVPPATVNSRWPGEAFAQGRVAMMVEANWAVPYLQENAPELDYGITTLPVGPAGAATVSFATCFALSARPLDEETATVATTAFLTYLANAEVQRSWFSVNTAIAPRPSLAPEWRAAHPSLQPFIAAIDSTDSAVEWQLPAGFQPWIEQMNDGLRRIFGGFIPTEALLPEAEALGNELLGVEGE